MLDPFSTAEVDFVRAGGNLWYVENIPDDGWNVMRWSNKGHRVVFPAVPSERNAIELLFSSIRPTSFRTQTAVHHQVARLTDVDAGYFPILL